MDRPVPPKPLELAQSLGVPPCEVAVRLGVTTEPPAPRPSLCPARPALAAGCSPWGSGICAPREHRLACSGMWRCSHAHLQRFRYFYPL